MNRRHDPLAATLAKAHAPLFPLFLNLDGKLAVVVGGGPVGRRKAAALLDAGARVRLVCLEQRPTDRGAVPLEWLAEPYRAAHLDGAALVFAAATAEINRQVLSDAHGRGLWVNVAGGPDAGDFFVPAVVRRGNFTVAIGTGGAAPGLAREVRALLERQFDEAFGHWSEILAGLRPAVLASIPDPARRQAVFAELCRWEWLERIRREGPEPVRAAMRSLVRDAGLS